MRGSADNYGSVKSISTEYLGMSCWSAGVALKLHFADQKEDERFAVAPDFFDFMEDDENSLKRVTTEIG